MIIIYIIVYIFLVYCMWYIIGCVVIIICEFICDVVNDNFGKLNDINVINVKDDDDLWLLFWLCIMNAYLYDVICIDFMIDNIYVWYWCFLPPCIYDFFLYDKIIWWFN